MAFLVRGIALDHPFVDGNKRTALEVAFISLRLNGYRLEADRDEAFSFVLSVARGTAGLRRIAEFLRANSRKV